jgi:hypothetical protein
MTTSNCLHCGAEFVPRRDWQKFCCEQHRKAYFKQQRKIERAEYVKPEGTPAEREAASQSLAEFIESLKPSEPVRRRA